MKSWSLTLALYHLQSSLTIFTYRDRLLSDHLNFNSVNNSIIPPPEFMIFQHQIQSDNILEQYFFVVIGLFEVRSWPLRRKCPNAFKSDLKTCFYYSLHWMYNYLLLRKKSCHYLYSFSYNFNKLLPKNNTILKRVVLSGRLKTVLLVLSQWRGTDPKALHAVLPWPRDTICLFSLEFVPTKADKLLGQLHLCC